MNDINNILAVKGRNFVHKISDHSILSLKIKVGVSNDTIENSNEVDCSTYENDHIGKKSYLF